MADLYRGLDAADVDGMARNAARIKAANIDFVLVYLERMPPTRVHGVTKAHIDALRKAGLAVGLIFEQGAKDSLEGADAGRRHTQWALDQARKIDAPPEVPIFATVDAGVKAGTAEMKMVSEYFGGFGAIAGYACGDVLTTLGTRLRYPWLAGAMGWPGSRDYYTNGPWAICQGTPMRGGHQLGIDWPNLGFEYDPDVARNLDWAWKPGDAAEVVAGLQEAVNAAKDSNIREGIKSIQALLATRGLYDGAIDGKFGPKTRAALEHFP